MTSIVLHNGSLRVEVLPVLGGKVSSIQLLPKGGELLQQPLLPYAERTRYMHFDDSDASGWDECLPSVAACEVSTPTGTACIPDHGDFWQVEWRIAAQQETSLTLIADGFSLPLRFTKTLQLMESLLRTSYQVENIGTFSADYIWSAHPLFAVDPGDRILLPPSLREVIVESSREGRLGAQGSRQSWPLATLANGMACDLSRVGQVTDRTGDKLFTPAPEEGWCAMDRVNLKTRIEVRFDPKILPWLGLWLCYGGWPEGKVKRQYCVALEPCTAMGDSLAAANKKKRAKTLLPGERHSWSMDLLINGIV